MALTQDEHDRARCRTAAKCSTCRERHNARQLAYARTAKGRATNDQWAKGESGKRYERERSRVRYATDPKYRATIRKSKGLYYKRNPLVAVAQSHRRRVIERTLEPLTADVIAQVFEKHGNKCVYCYRDDVKLTLDHVMPVSLGGTNDADNLVPACKSCNSRKAARIGVAHGAYAG